MAQQLQAVGWQGNTNDAAAVAAAYASTTGGAVTPGAGGPSVSSGGGGGGSTGQDQGFNAAAANSAVTLANNAAQIAYNNARLQQLEIPQFQALSQQAKDQLAFDKAKEAWSQTFQQANADVANKNATANITGTFDGQPTLAAQTQQQTAANQYLTLLSTLRGPANAFQYAKTLQGTPQGLTDIVNSAAGRYQLGGAPSGAVAAPASLNNLLSDVNNPGAVMNGGPGGAPLDPNALKLPAASQIDSRAYNAMLPTQRDLLWGAYEYGLGPSGPMIPADAQTAYANSLPKYAPPTTGSFMSPASGGAARSF
jgi:hypothetical protein